MPVEIVGRLIARVDEERMRRRLFHLSSQSLPFRKANATLPGHEKSTLAEADDFIAGCLAESGYDVRFEACQVQAFRCDAAKPPSEQYSPAAPEDPWYAVHNLYAERKGRSRPGEIVLLIAHKDSQSWNNSPGAYDNAVGTVALLEMASLLGGTSPGRATSRRWRPSSGQTT